MSIENKLREAFEYNNEKVDKRYPYAMSAINYYDECFKVIILRSQPIFYSMR